MTIDDLIPSPRNPRRISARAALGLRASLERFADIAGIVFNARTRQLVCGHQRVAQLRSLGAVLQVSGDDHAIVLGDRRWPVRVVDWDHGTETAANLAANSPLIMGEFDPSLLSEAIDSLGDAIGDDGDFAGLMLGELPELPEIAEPEPEHGNGEPEEEPDEEEPEDALDLIAPYPWFGGKSRIARAVWRRFGDVGTYIEPFLGSGAVLLARPSPWDSLETVNDIDGMVANFWRALKAEPEKLAEIANWPRNENDLHARHAWLVGRKETLQERLEGDPDYYDVRVAGWWVWGMACWLGGGFCSGAGGWVVEDGRLVKNPRNATGQGVQRRRVQLGPGRGVQRKLVHLGGGQVAGRGEQGLVPWMQALAERLQRVLVCCGDWTRICGGPSGDAITHMIQQLPCGVFLDPPYSLEAGREMSIYRCDSGTVAHAVREWAIAYGDDERFRIALCGYEGEHHMPPGWIEVKWKTSGGMGKMGDGRGKENRFRERVWFSPHCLRGV